MKVICCSHQQICQDLDNTHKRTIYPCIFITHFFLCSRPWSVSLNAAPFMLLSKNSKARNFQLNLNTSRTCEPAGSCIHAEQVWHLPMAMSLPLVFHRVNYLRVMAWCHCLVIWIVVSVSFQCLQMKKGSLWASSSALFWTVCCHCTACWLWSLMRVRCYVFHRGIHWGLQIVCFLQLLVTMFSHVFCRLEGSLRWWTMGIVEGCGFVGSLISVLGLMKIGKKKKKLKNASGACYLLC